ncbi:PaaI family thioesterase [Kribbella lupini]|uniref:PaaI family thioesterase n=1 Tax=Kribbella lupini TaxID=291602 RepID=A0ABP4NDE7_9ACTN
MTITAEDVYALAPFARTLGVEFGELSAGTPVGARLAYRPELSTTNGGLHGGALMGLADISAAVCAVLHAPPGALPATMESSTHFMNPVRGDASATATALHVGRSAITVNVDVFDPEGRLCVRVTQLVAVRVSA